MEICKLKIDRTLSQSWSDVKLALETKAEPAVSEEVEDELLLSKVGPALELGINRGTSDGPLAEKAEEVGTECEATEETEDDKECKRGAHKEETAEGDGASGAQTTSKRAVDNRSLSRMHSLSHWQPTIFKYC